MNKIKNLKILNILVFLMLIGNIKVFATKENLNNNILKNSQINIKKEPSQININMEGLNFNEILSNKYGDTFYFNEKCCILANIFSDQNMQENITVFYPAMTTNDNGLLHLLEHLLTCLEIGREKGKEQSFWQSLSCDSKNENAGLNAHTRSLNEAANLAYLLFYVNDYMLNNMDIENIVKNISDELNGNSQAVSSEKTTKREISRMFLEMERRQNPSGFGGVREILEKEIRDVTLRNLMYDYGGTPEKIQQIKYEDVKDFYNKNIVNGKPIIFLQFRNLEKAKKVISLFKKYLFDNKKEYNITNIGKEKFVDRDYFKMPISKILAKAKNIFKIYEPTEYETKNLAKIRYDIHDLDIYDKEILKCLNKDYIKNKINEIMREYEIKDIKTRISNEDEDIFELLIYTDNEEILKEKNIKKIVEKISNEVTKHKIIPSDLDENTQKLIMRGIYCGDYDYLDISKKIMKSLIFYNKPFSNQYFKLDEKNQIEKDIKKFAEYINSYSGDILKRVLNENIKKKFVIYKKEEGDCDLAEINRNIKKPTILPFFYSDENIKNIAAILVADEVIIRQLNKNLNDEGKVYIDIAAPNIINNFEFYGTKIETQNVKEFFDNGEFKNCLEEIQKEKDSYFDQIIKMSGRVIESIENNLKKYEDSVKKAIEILKELKNEKEINIKKLEKVRKLGDISYLNDGMMITKISKEEDIEQENLNKLTDQIRSKYKELRYKMENTNSKVLDETAKKLYHDILDMNIELETKNLEMCENCLKKIKTIKKQNSELKANIIKNILKNIKIKKFDEVNNK